MPNVLLGPVVHLGAFCSLGRDTGFCAETPFANKKPFLGIAERQSRAIAQYGATKSGGGFPFPGDCTACRKATLLEDVKSPLEVLEILMML